MNSLMKKLTGIVVTTVVTLSALPFAATPVFAAGGATCEIKLHPDGTAYTECLGDGATTEEEWFNAAQQAVTDYETSTGDYVEATWAGVVHSVSKDEPTVEPTSEPTPAPVHTCQDDGYPAGYYWSESAQACVTDYVEPTPAPTPVPTPVPTPTVAPATPTPTTTAEIWDYEKVSSLVLNKINETRNSKGIASLTLRKDAVVDATQRASESLEYSKTVTAYGTSTDGHVGFDTEWGDNEALGFISRLSENATEEEIAEEVYKNLTTGVTKQDSILSDRYNEVALGFADAHFTRRNGSDLGHNVYFSILLGK